MRLRLGPKKRLVAEHPKLCGPAPESIGFSFHKGPPWQSVCPATLLDQPGLFTFSELYGCNVGCNSSRTDLPQSTVPPVGSTSLILPFSPFLRPNKSIAQVQGARQGGWAK